MTARARFDANLSPLHKVEAPGDTLHEPFIFIHLLLDPGGSAVLGWQAG